MSSRRKIPRLEENFDQKKCFKHGIFPFLLILVFMLQSFRHAQDKSATYDEPGHLTISYLLAKTRHSDYDIGHPPLIRFLFAIPRFWTDASLPTQMPAPEVPESVPLSQRPPGSLYVYSNYFLYGNSIPADMLLLNSRVVGILLGCLLGFWVYRWSKKLYGPKGALFSLTLFALCPNLIAHSSLVTTDIGGITFAVGALYALTMLIEKNTAKNIIYAGFLLGLALLSKFTNLFLVPLFVVIYFLGNRNSDHKQKNIFTKVKTIFAVMAVGWFVLCMGYRFDRVFIAHTLQEEDWQNLGFGKPFQTFYRYAPIPDTYLKGICFAVSHDKRGHGAFFLGRYSSQGWWSYFPVAFILKTPVVVLLFLAGWLALLIRKKETLTFPEWILILPAIFLVGTSLTARLNIGLRHILLCYPLFYVLLGKLQTLSFTSHRKGKILTGILLFFLAAETFSVSPHYLAFFNRLCGGPEKGIHFLSDSNIDWGQDLKNLSVFLKKQGNPEVLLSYFGTGIPQYYGITYQGLPTVWSFPKSEHVNSIVPKKEYCAVSVTNLQGTYFSDHNLYGWLKHKKPIAKIGFSIYVYDITEDLESQVKFKEIYGMTGEKAKFIRQTRRLKNLKSSF